MIRVLIADDHEIVRLGLRGYLETEGDMEVVGLAGDGEEAVRLAGERVPDVILMDLLMPRVTGIEATRRLHAAQCPSRVVVLTSSVDDGQVVEALRAGALSYILKTSTARQVVESVRLAARGESVLDAQVQKSLVGHLQTQTQSQREAWQDLTQRELDVLRALASGRNNQEIADLLQIGVKTVKSHISNVFIKLGVEDRTQAAIYAVRHGLDR